VCDLETSRMGAPYIYDISHLRVNIQTSTPHQQNIFIACWRISEGSNYVCCAVRNRSLLSGLILNFISRDMSQTVSISIPGQSCETCFGQSGTGTGFSRVLWVLTVIVSSVLHTRFYLHVAFTIKTGGRRWGTLQTIVFLKRGIIARKINLACMVLCIMI